MTSRGWLFGAALFGLLASACVGGQSGVELEPASGCHTAVRAVAAGEMTGAGSVEELAAAAEQVGSVPLHLSAHEGSDFDTMLTLQASIIRTSGVYHEVETPGPAGAVCRPFLSVYAHVRFDTAEGSFMDVFPGVLEKSDGQTVFVGELSMNKHAGTLDLGSLAQKANVATTLFSIQTTLGAQPSGRLFLDGGTIEAPPDTDPIANWP